jgi:hypothetical protein
MPRYINGGNQILNDDGTVSWAPGVDPSAFGDTPEQIAAAAQAGARQGLQYEAQNFGTNRGAVGALNPASQNFGDTRTSFDIARQNPNLVSAIPQAPLNANANALLGMYQGYPKMPGYPGMAAPGFAGDMFNAPTRGFNPDQGTWNDASIGGVVGDRNADIAARAGAMGGGMGGGGVTSLGWRSPEGYEAVQDASGKRYYRTAQGQYLDPQTGAQVANPGGGGGATHMLGNGQDPFAGGAYSTLPYRTGDPNGDIANRMAPWGGAPRGAYPQMPGYPGGGRMLGNGQNPSNSYYQDPNNPDMMRYASGSSQQPSAQNPRVPPAYQVNPMVWDSLGPVGKELARGAIGATGQDAGEYEYQLNQARPRGSAPRSTSMQYAPSRNAFTGGYRF